MMNKILVALVALLLVVIIGIVAIKNITGDSTWYAVYLRTGELYFGHLSRFPYFGLRNVYMLQTNPSNTQTPLSIQKFSKVFWGPEDSLRINREEVIWMAKLQSGGQLAQVLTANPELEAPAANQNADGYSSELPPQYLSSTSTRK